MGIDYKKMSIQANHCTPSAWWCSLSAEGFSDFSFFKSF